MQGAGGVGGLLWGRMNGPAPRFAAFDGNGNVSALVNQKRSTGTRYYGYDGLGSVRYLTARIGGSVTDTYTYDAFGIQIASSGSTLNNYRYTGEQWDDDLKLYYLRARYYKPELGRFWSMDTFEGNNQDPLSLHKYLYCHLDPINNIDPSGNAIHHKVPQSLTKKFSKKAQKFFDSKAATVLASKHDYSSHGAYNSRCDELMKEWLANNGVAAGEMTDAQAKSMLAFLENDPFVAGFNLIVPQGPEEITRWMFEDGHKLLPQHLKEKAFQRAYALGARKGWFKTILKKGTGPYLTIGFAVLTANRMYAQGASQDEIAKAVADDLLWGLPGMAEAGTDMAWARANQIATMARNGAFSYLDYDEEKDYGGNGLLISDQAVNSVLNRQSLGGHTVTAGSLIGGF